MKERQKLGRFHSAGAERQRTETTGNEKMSRVVEMSGKRQRIEEHHGEARRSEQQRTRPVDPVSGGLKAFSPRGAN